MSFLDELQQFKRDVICSVLQNEEDATPWLNNAVRSIPGSRARPLTKADRAPYELARRTVCRLGRDPQSPSVTFPDKRSFEGGQCDTEYRVRGVLNTTSNGQPAFVDRDTTGSRLYQGPIERVFISDDGQAVIVQHNGGAESDLIRFPASRINVTSFTDVTVERVDGLPDDCGNVPGTSGPGETGNPSGPGTLDYEDEDGNTVSEPVDVTVRPPIVGPGGDINISTEICFPAFCLDVNIDLGTGDITVGIGGSQKGGECCPPFEDLPEGPDDSDPPPPEDESRYAGVITRCTLLPTGGQFTQVGDGIGPDIFLPRLGVVRFAVEIGGRRTWTIDKPIKTLSQFTPSELPGVAYSWSVLPEKGVSIQTDGVPYI